MHYDSLVSLWVNAAVHSGIDKGNRWSLPFRSAGRQPGQAGRVCYPVLAESWVPFKALFGMTVRS
jgi:hypothetical protein